MKPKGGFALSRKNADRNRIEDKAINIIFFLKNETISPRMEIAENAYPTKRTKGFLK